MGLLLMLISPLYTTVPPNNPKGHPMDVKKGDETESLVLRWWKLITCIDFRRFCRVRLWKRIFKKVIWGSPPFLNQLSPVLMVSKDLQRMTNQWTPYLLALQEKNLWKNSASDEKWLKSYYTAIKSKENDSFSDLKSIFLLSCKNLATETNRFSSVGVALQSLALNLERWCIQTLIARFRPFFESTWWYHL